MMMVSGILRNTFVVLSVSALLTACGGGGGTTSEAGSGAANPPLETAVPGSGGIDYGDGAAPEPSQQPTQPGEPTQPAQPVSKSATLTWQAPTTKTDGSCLDGLASYRISYGLAPGVYKHTEELDASQLSCTASGATDACGQPVTCSFMVDNLSSASWYFAIQAVDSAGKISAYSNEGLKTVQ